MGVTRNRIDLDQINPDIIDDRLTTLEESSEDLSDRMESAEAMINTIPQWEELELTDVVGTAQINRIMVNKATHEVKVSFQVTGTLGGSGNPLATVPEGYRPAKTQYAIAAAVNNTPVANLVPYTLNTNGIIAQGGSGNCTALHVEFNYFY